jgi:hypothetical protein
MFCGGLWWFGNDLGVFVVVRWKGRTDGVKEGGWGR